MNGRRNFLKKLVIGAPAAACALLAPEVTKSKPTSTSNGDEYEYLNGVTVKPISFQTGGTLTTPKRKSMMTDLEDLRPQRFSPSKVGESRLQRFSPSKVEDGPFITFHSVPEEELCIGPWQTMRFRREADFDVKFTRPTVDEQLMEQARRTVRMRADKMVGELSIAPNRVKDKCCPYITVEEADRYFANGFIKWDIDPVASNPAKGKLVFNESRAKAALRLVKTSTS